MFLESFQITGTAVFQIFLLAAVGFFLVKKHIFGPQGIDALARLVIQITFPILIFCQLVKDFRFSLYPDWWIFPLLSIMITFAGLVVGALFSVFIRGRQKKLQFLSLITFQNAGYLPLVLVAALLPQEKINSMFIYIFLFLLGFNLIIWSMGVYLLTFSRAKRFELGSLFSPPVIATVFSLLFVAFNLPKFVPQFVLRPLVMVGDCTFPLAMFVMGGNLAQIHLKQIDKKAIFLMSLAKMVILPLLGLWTIINLKLPQLMGLLILIQLAMPPATSLSLITNHYKKEDLLISQGVFFGHIIGIIAIPIFLSLYFALVMIK